MIGLGSEKNQRDFYDLVSVPLLWWWDRWLSLSSRDVYSAQLQTSPLFQLFIIISVRICSIVAFGVSKVIPIHSRLICPSQGFRLLQGKNFWFVLLQYTFASLLAIHISTPFIATFFQSIDIIPFSFWPVVCCVKQWCNSSCLPNLWLKRNHSRPRSFDSGKTELQTGAENQYLGILNFPPILNYWLKSQQYLLLPEK